MRIEELKLFKFDELSDAAKEKARDWYREASLDDWQFDYDDLKANLLDSDTYPTDFPEYLLQAIRDKTIYKIEIKELDTYRGNCEVKVHYWDKNMYLLRLTNSDFKMTESTKKRIAEYLDQWDEYEQGIKFHNELFGLSPDEYVHEIEGEFEHYFLKYMQDAEEYRNSDEYINETIQCNEYEFTENGKLC